MVCSANYYDKEKACHGVVTPLLETLLGHDIEKFWSLDETSVDGTILFELGLPHRKVWSRGGIYHSSLFRAFAYKPTRIPNAMPSAAPYPY